MNKDEKIVYLILMLERMVSGGVVSIKHRPEDLLEELDVGLTIDTPNLVERLKEELVR